MLQNIDSLKFQNEPTTSRDYRQCGMSKRLAGTFSGLGYWPAASCLEFHLGDLLETEIFRADNAQRTSFDGSKANEPSTRPLVVYPKRRMAKNCTTVPPLIPEKLIHGT